MTATDISTEALATAAANAAAAGVSNRFTALHSDWFSAICGKFHAIVSNPPYIRSEEIDGLQDEVRLPIRARRWMAGQTASMRTGIIADGAAAFLEHDGQVAVEIGHTQRQEVERLFAQAGYRLISMHRDLGGSDRAMVFSL